MCGSADGERLLLQRWKWEENNNHWNYGSCFCFINWERNEIQRQIFHRLVHSLNSLQQPRLKSGVWNSPQTYRVGGRHLSISANISCLLAYTLAGNWVRNGVARKWTRHFNRRCRHPKQWPTTIQNTYSWNNYSNWSIKTRHCFKPFNN